MSDTTEAPTAPPESQPAATPAPSEGEGGGQPKPKPVSARDFFAGNTRRSETPAPSPAAPEGEGTPVGKVDGQGRPHGAAGSDKPGQYLPGKAEGEAQATKEAGAVGGDGQEAGTAEGAGDTPAAAESGTGDESQAAPEGEAPAKTAESEATEVPDGYVRIEIPEALQRNFGREQVVPKEQEEFFRFNLNNHVRNNEVEKFRADAARAKELEQQLEQERQERLKFEVGSSAQGKFLQTEDGQEIRREYERLKQAEADGALEEGTASRYWQRAAQPAFESFVSGELSTRNDEFTAQRHAEAGQRWANEAERRALHEAPDRLKSLPGYQQIVKTALEDFDLLVEREGRFPLIDQATTPDELEQAAHQEFQRFLVTRIHANPEANKAFREQLLAEQKGKVDAEAATRAGKAKAQADREAEARRRKEAEEQALRAATNPMGNVSPSQTGRTSGDRQPMNARQFDEVMRRR